MIKRLKKNEKKYIKKNKFKKNEKITILQTWRTLIRKKDKEKDKENQYDLFKKYIYCNINYHSLFKCWFKIFMLINTEWQERNNNYIKKLKKRYVIND